jgi:hypothetical protein
MKEKEIIEQLNKNTPFKGFNGIRITNVFLKSKESELTKDYDNSFLIRESNLTPRKSDLTIKIDFSGIQINFIAETKSMVTPKILEQIGPWLVRIKDSNPKESYILTTPYISANSQNYCINNDINFLDLSGNIFIKIPGKVMIQRLDQPNKFPFKQVLRNPFWGASSRVPRVLLQNPKRTWGVFEIEEELLKESEKQKIDFKLSRASISKTIKSLEEELLIRRNQRKVLVPDPKQLLFKWAEKYKEMNRRTVTECLDIKNPFSLEFPAAISGLMGMLNDISAYAATGTAAANLLAPYTDVDKIDIKVIQSENSYFFGPLPEQKSIGPEFDMCVAKDNGMIMYANEINGIRIASDIQIYLDCYSKGGRDLKQAEYLLEKVIEKRWADND